MQRNEPGQDESRALEWSLGAMRGQGISSDEVEAHLAPGWRNAGALVGILMMSGYRLGEFERTGIARREDGVLEAELRDRRDRAWSLRLRLDERARILGVSVFRPPPQGVTIRPVTTTDWRQLAWPLASATPTSCASTRTSSPRACSCR